MRGRIHLAVAMVEGIPPPERLDRAMAPADGIVDAQGNKMIGVIIPCLGNAAAIEWTAGLLPLLTVQQVRFRRGELIFQRQAETAVQPELDTSAHYRRKAKRRPSEAVLGMIPFTHGCPR